MKGISLRPVACFPNEICGFLITLALPLVGEMFTGIGFATVPAAIRELPQPSALRLSDLPRQLVVDYLTPRELNEFMRATRYEHQQLSKLRQNTIRRSPWGVQVRTSEGTTWLDPAEDKGWDQVEEILEVNPRCLEQRPPSGKGLLERLPLPSWKGQALQAAKDETEPPYLRILSRLLSFRLASIVELTPPPPSTANLHSRKVKAAQTLLSMDRCLGVTWNAAWIAASNAAWNATLYPASIAASNATTKAARKAALYPAMIASGSAVEYAATNPALSAGFSVAVDAATNPTKNAAKDAAGNAAKDAITQLFAHSPVDAPPSAELIGKTAYRSAELTALLSVLKQIEAVVQRVFTQTKNFFPEKFLLPMFVDLPAWKDFKIRHFSSADENIVHYWQPWLMKIDQFVDDTDYLDSSARTLLPEVE